MLDLVIEKPLHCEPSKPSYLAVAAALVAGGRSVHPPFSSRMLQLVPNAKNKYYVIFLGH